MSSYKTICLLVVRVFFLFGQNITADQAHTMLHKNPFIKPIEIVVENVPSNDEKAPSDNLILRGTMSSGDEAIANINGEMLIVGQSINGFEVKHVNLSSVVLINDGKERVLTLNDISLNENGNVYE